MKDQTVNTKRRGFLLAAGAGSAAVAGTVALTTLPTAQKQPLSAEKISNAKQGYRESAHVRDYYDTARV